MCARAEYMSNALAQLRMLLSRTNKQVFVAVYSGIGEIALKCSNFGRVSTDVKVLPGRDSVLFLPSLTDEYVSIA